MIAANNASDREANDDGYVFLFDLTTIPLVILGALEVLS